MQTEAAQKIYHQRSQIAEFPHARIKERCGLRQFRCRGQEKTGMEATWACLSYNIIRLFSIRRKIGAATVAAAKAKSMLICFSQPKGILLECNVNAQSIMFPMRSKKRIQGHA